MSVDPAVSGKDAIRAVKKLGFRVDRIEGSHHVMVKEKYPFAVPVPVHGSRTRPKGTLASIIRTAGVVRKQFYAALTL
jgi:predicted RNA binding protein YcfA (HicA-like mRNA interferase family)